MDALTDRWKRAPLLPTMALRPFLAVNLCLCARPEARVTHMTTTHTLMARRRCSQASQYPHPRRSINTNRVTETASPYATYLTAAYSTTLITLGYSNDATPQHDRIGVDASTTSHTTTNPRTEWMLSCMHSSSPSEQSLQWLKPGAASFSHLRILAFPS